MSGSGDYPEITIPLEAWRQIVRRTRMLEAIHSQTDVIVRSLVETVNAVPADEAGNARGDHDPTTDR